TSVVATLFVLYDFARQVGGEDVTVSLLIPPGAEPHSFEPSPRDVVAVRKADVFFYGGKAMDPWAERLVAQTSGKGPVIADASRGIELLYAGEAHVHGDEGNHHEASPGDGIDPSGGDQDRGHADPHFWLDPVRALTMVDTIRDALTAADPAHGASYAERARVLKNELKALDEEIRHTLARRIGNIIIFGGHNMWRYFAARYGLEFLSPYPGFSPEAEPQGRRLVELTELMRTRGLSVIYHEERIDPKTARVLAEATGARLEVLHGAHNVSPEEIEAGVSYISLMKENLATLQTDPGLFPDSAE
ncbi:MAG TPA: zinc ABC transporter substrate-binding protein, partial [Spirochaetia bacterium]|nr:zinc ABC transporter substrate-binding protein [Spirochaetia bacterium]